MPVGADQVVAELPGERQRDVVIVGVPQQIQVLSLPSSAQVCLGQQPTPRLLAVAVTLHPGRQWGVAGFSASPGG